MKPGHKKKEWFRIKTMLLAIFGQILALKPPQGFKKTAKKWLVSMKPPTESNDNQKQSG